MRASHVMYLPSCAVDISKEVISASKAVKPQLFITLALWKMISRLCDLDNENCMAAEHIQLMLTVQMNGMCTSCILLHQC